MSAGELPLQGYCVGEPNAIEACLWTVKSTGSGSSSGGDKKKKGKDKEAPQQRFMIVW